MYFGYYADKFMQDSLSPPNIICILIVSTETKQLMK